MAENPGGVGELKRVKVEEDIPGRAKKISFSKEEDYYLKSGIKKHGWGNWTAILRDRSFKQ